MKFITWDIGVVAAFCLLLAYSLLIRKHKALATLISVYIAYVMAASWGERISQFFTGDRVLFKQVWIQANASPFVVRAILLVILTFLLSSFIKLGGKRGRYSMPEVGVYATCTLALAVMFIISFMPPEMHDAVMKTSKILPLVDRFREWVLVVPVFAMIFFGIYGDDDQ